MISNYKTLLKERSFIFLWLSQLLSQVTINMLNFIILVHLFNKTGSTIATSFLWIAYALPAILFGPFASVLVDIYSRKRLLVATNLIQAILIFIFSFSRPEGVYLYFVVAFIYSFINQFYVPSEAASLPSVVNKENLPRANGLFFITQQAAIILGFGLAGPINSLFGFRYSLIISSIFMFMAFLSVLFIKGLNDPNKPSSAFEVNIMDFFARIYEGYTFIKNNRRILLPFILLLSLQSGLAVIMVSVPVIADSILKVDVNLAGLLVVVLAAIGAVIGAGVIPNLIRKGSRKKTIIENAVLMLGLALLLLSLGQQGNVTTFKIVIALLNIVLVGFAFVGILIPSQTFLQEETPGGMRGRVFGNFWFIVTVVNIVPVIFSGAIVELLGIRTLLIIMGLIALIGYYVVKTNKINIRNA